MIVLRRALAFAAVMGAISVASAPSPVDASSDPAAVALAESTLAVMGGRDAWNATRFLRWTFSGRRIHHWDKGTGDVRIASGTSLVLMNVISKTGRAWENGVEITEEMAIAAALEDGYGAWVNDSYWLVMPYKLLDPGVVLRDGAEDALLDGRPAHKIVVTFENVGLTPGNKYDVWIAKDTGLVEEWAYYENGEDAQPRFRLPWGGWETFGKIRLATKHGRDQDWNIAVFDTLPRTLFENP